jgi:hypothetical protein
LGDIGLEKCRFSTRTVNQTRGFCAALNSDVGHDDLGPLTSKNLRGSPAYA